jgi:DNA-binding transcriptional ArsR family regulator
VAHLHRAGDLGIPRFGPSIQLTLTQVMTYIQSMDAALKAVAEPRRRQILRIIWLAKLPATEIAIRVGEVTRSAVSQHLAVLKGANLVVERRDGTRRLYRSNLQEMARLRSFLDEFWTTGLERLRDAVETYERTTEGTDG